MRDFGISTARLAIAAAAALAVAGCGDSEEGTNTADMNALDANLLLDQPANDAGALESAVNATEPMTTNTGEGSNATDLLGETKGGDTGGNTLDRNISGT